MKLRRLLFIPLLAASAICQAPPDGKPLMLWKVSNDKNTAYMFGSLHIGDKSFYPLPDVVENAFSASNVLILEVDIKKVNMMALASMVMEEGMYSGDDSLWKHISPETRKGLEAYASKVGVSADMFATMKPWMAAMTLAVLPYQKAGMDPTLGLDQHFADESGDKRIDQIESAEWQIKLFTSLSPELQEKLLATSVDPTRDPLAESKELVAAWQSGDASRVEGLMNKYSDGPPEFERKILTDRNPHMADAVSHCLETSDHCFMVVGAAHLIGKDGIVSLLAKRGVKVEQMKTGEPDPAAKK
jgi:uncharacterized protein YbaP (TraB family)